MTYERFGVEGGVMRFVKGLAVAVGVAASFLVSGVAYADLSSRFEPRCFGGHDSMTKERFESLKESALKGGNLANYCVSDIYWFGEGAEEYFKVLGIQRDWSEAIKHYKLSVEQNEIARERVEKVMSCSTAESLLEDPSYYGMIGGAGLYDSGDYIRAAACYWVSAVHGNSVSQSQLGQMYYEGLGVSQDFSESAKWHKLAADNGNSSSQLMMGLMYGEGSGVPIDHSESVKYFKMAADQGESAAYFALGIAYYEGEGIDQDYTEALKWLLLSSEDGHSLTYYFLGKMYDLGLGTPEDNVEAVKWLVLSAEQGDSYGQFRLGLMHLKGEGVQQDSDKAVELLTSSSKQCNVSAAIYLASLYYSGEEVPKNLIQAYMLFDLAAALTKSTKYLDMARHGRYEIHKILTPTEISHAQKTL